jgi:hypothetical protein
MDGTGDYHVKWNKPDSERQIFHVLSYKQNPDLKQKRQESKRGTIWEKEGEQWEERQENVMSKEGEYDQSRFYTYVKEMTYVTHYLYN